MNILLIATEFSPGMIPYACSVINDRSLLEGHEVYVVVVNSGKKSFSRIIADKERVFEIEYPENKLGKIGYKFFPIKTINKIKSVINEKSIDVVHFLTEDFSLFPFWSVFKGNVVDVYTVHDLLPHETKGMSFLGSLLHKYVLWAKRKFRDKSQALTTSSRTQTSFLKEIYPTKLVKYTPFPSLVTRPIENGGKEPPELQNEDEYILFFGNVDYYKGVDMLVEVFNENENQLKHKLVIAGRGLDYQGGENIIRINRFIDDEEIESLFKKAKLVVYPYRSITMSGVLSLAMYYNKRILASDLDFFLQYQSESVIYFKNGIKESLTQKLLNECDCIQSVCNKDDYNQFYSTQNRVQSYLELYEHIEKK